MSDMIERIARAMYEAERERVGAGPPWERLKTTPKSRWMVRASDALTPLLDPTPEIVEAGEDLVRQNNSRWIYAHEVEMDRAFNAMIKAIQEGE
tara:strand:- start:24682 stop:24963 length:282 start_codon:yes stop_codon:yes gene_type:complete